MKITHSFSRHIQDVTHIVQPSSTGSAHSFSKHPFHFQADPKIPFQAYSISLWIFSRWIYELNTGDACWRIFF